IRFVDGKAGGTLETADLVSSLGPLAQEFHQALVEFVNFLTPVGDVHEIQVSGLRSQVSGLRSQVSGLRSQVSGLRNAWPSTTTSARQLHSYDSEAYFSAHLAWLTADG